MSRQPDFLARPVFFPQPNPDPHPGGSLGTAWSSLPPIFGTPRPTLPLSMTAALLGSPSSPIAAPPPKDSANSCRSPSPAQLFLTTGACTLHVFGVVIVAAAVLCMCTCVHVYVYAVHVCTCVYAGTMGHMHLAHLVSALPPGRRRRLGGTAL